jgi:hypothetical protein
MRRRDCVSHDGIECRALLSLKRKKKGKSNQEIRVWKLKIRDEYKDSSNIPQI